MLPVAEDRRPPFIRAGAERGEAPVEPLGALREPPGGVVRGDAARGVGPVEGEAELVGGPPESGRRRGPPLGHVPQRRQVETVASEGRPLPGERHGLPADGGRREHVSVYRLVVRERGRSEGARREGVHRAALAVEQVMRRRPRRRGVVGLAQLLDEDVAHVVSGRREAPRVVRRAPDQDVHRETGHRGALCRVPGPVEIQLLDDLRVVVAELGTHHRQRVAGSGARRRRHEKVGRPQTWGTQRHLCQRLPRVDALDRTGIEDDRAGHRPAGEHRVVEALGDRRRSLGIVGEHHVGPDLGALIGAELLLELREEVRVRRLGAAAGAEDRADERGDRDDVVHGERGLVDVVRRVVRVDAVGVRLRVGDDLVTHVLLVRLDDEVCLRRHEGFGRRARCENLDARHQRERVDVRHVGNRDARRAASDQEEEPAVPRCRPSGPVRDVRLRLPVDVRDAVVVVDDLAPGPAGHLCMGGRDRLEVLREVELVDVGERHVVAERRQARVERELIRGVRRRREPAEVAGREDVAGEVRTRGGRSQHRERHCRVEPMSHARVLPVRATDRRSLPSTL